MIQQLQLHHNSNTYKTKDTPCTLDEHKHKKRNIQPHEFRCYPSRNIFYQDHKKIDGYYYRYEITQDKFADDLQNGNIIWRKRYALYYIFGVYWKLQRLADNEYVVLPGRAVSQAGEYYQRLGLFNTLMESVDYIREHDNIELLMEE